jgi:hypothetical protein
MYTLQYLNEFSGLYMRQAIVMDSRVQRFLQLGYANPLMVA